MEDIDNFIAKQKLRLLEDKFRLGLQEVDSSSVVDNRDVQTDNLNKNDVTVNYKEKKPTNIPKRNEKIYKNPFKLYDEVNKENVEAVSSVIDNKNVLTDNLNKNDVTVNYKEKEQTNIPKRNEKVYKNPFKLYDEVNKENVEAVSEKHINLIDNKSQKLVKVRHSDGGSVHDLVARNKNFGNSNVMDKWENDKDKFYSYFPSFNQQNAEKKQTLLRARQKEYQEYLKQKIPTESSKKKTTKKLIENEKNHLTEINNNFITKDNKLQSETHQEVIEVTNIRNITRHRLLEDLKHTDLPALNSDLIREQKKRKEVEKKMEYQKELIKQIEEKKKEIEKLKEKERLEEEMLTKKLQEQLKTLELEEELEKEKSRSEKVRLNNEQNHQVRVHMLSKLENDHKIYNPYKDRKTQSENGKDKFSKEEDTKLYKYFSNSARYDKNNRRSIVETDLEEETADDRYQYCKKCRSDISESFFNIKRVPDLRKLCAKCDSHYHASVEKFLCSECNKKSENCPHCDKNFNFCFYCNRNKEFCLNCNRVQAEICPNCLRVEKSTRNRNSSRDDRPIRGSDSSYQLLDETESEQDLSDLKSILVRRSTKPFSLNLEKDSIFHPDKKIVEPKLTVNIKNGEIYVDKLDDFEIGNEKDYEILRKKNDEKMSSYVRNYDDLRIRKKNIPNNRTTTYRNIMPIPSYRNILPKVDNGKSPSNIRNRSDAMKTLERKWEVPAVERTSITESRPRVLTQLGAIRKHLQLEQLQLDQTSK